CQVSSFKRPTPVELRHDYLWRGPSGAPGAGAPRSFNRSPHQDGLVGRGHQPGPGSGRGERPTHLNTLPRLLVDSRTTVLKFLLHISKEEQKRRLEERLADPTKNWKFEVGDLEERKLWEQYTTAYEDMLRETSTEWAPWYVVPGDKKHARDLLIAETV